VTQLDEECEEAEETGGDGAIQKRDSRGLFKKQSKVSILLYKILNALPSLRSQMLDGASVQMNQQKKLA